MEWWAIPAGVTNEVCHPAGFSLASHECRPKVYRDMAEHIVDFEEALRLVLEAARSVPRQPSTKPVDLLASLGRVLAEPIHADRDQPAFDRATRDGFAVLADQLRAGPLQVAGQVRAGERWAAAWETETALEIMTGAPLPEGADAVVMLEHVEHAAAGLTLTADRTIEVGDHVVARGSEAKAGDLLLAPGVRMGAAEIALAATCGYASLLVFERPHVAMIATGDELVEVAETPGPDQIRNSNSYALAALVANAGGKAMRQPIARDTREDVRASIVAARTPQTNLLLLSGGVSMGKYDLVEEILTDLGADFLFTGVRMQPGKPVVCGRLPAQGEAPACFFFGLPGNPMSTQVTFHCFAELFVRSLAGERTSGLRWAQATLAEAVAPKPGLTRLLPCRSQNGTARLVGWQGSGDLAANARANCYVELLPGRAYQPGEVVRVLLR